jgi:hypothetical protein
MDIKEHSYLSDYFKDKGFDYVEFLGEFFRYKVYRACYDSEEVLAPIPTILVKNNKFRCCRYGYETRVVYDYLEKGKESYSRWQIASIRMSLFFDKLFTFIIVLLIPNKEFGFVDKIKLMRGMKLDKQE